MPAASRVSVGITASTGSSCLSRKNPTAEKFPGKGLIIIGGMVKFAGTVGILANGADISEEQKGTHSQINPSQDTKK